MQFAIFTGRSSRCTVFVIVVRGLIRPRTTDGYDLERGARHPLNLTGKTGLRRDPAKGTAAQVGVGSGEPRCIGRVIGFQPERKSYTFGNACRLAQRRVKDSRAGSSHIADVTCQISKGESGRLHVGTTIEIGTGRQSTA